MYIILVDKSKQLSSSSHFTSPSSSTNAFHSLRSCNGGCKCRQQWKLCANVADDNFVAHDYIVARYNAITCQYADWFVNTFASDCNQSTSATTTIACLSITHRKNYRSCFLFGNDTSFHSPSIPFNATTMSNNDAIKCQ